MKFNPLCGNCEIVAFWFYNFYHSNFTGGDLIIGNCMNSERSLKREEESCVKPQRVKEPRETSVAIRFTSAVNIAKVFHADLR